jgi:hypothetical protein
MWAVKHGDMLAAGTRVFIYSTTAKSTSVSLQLLVLPCRDFDLSLEADGSTLPARSLASINPYAVLRSRAITFIDVNSVFDKKREDLYCQWSQ